MPTATLKGRTSWCASDQVAALAAVHWTVPGPNSWGSPTVAPTFSHGAWVGVPDQAVAVQFTDQDGTATWERAADRLVIFPDTVGDDPEGFAHGVFPGQSMFEQQRETTGKYLITTRSTGPNGKGVLLRT